MATILLLLLVLVLGTCFMLKCYSDFKSYRDPAFAVFFTATGIVMVILVLAFLHFKPWL
ncbi:membrane protein [Pseudomonas phage Zuri]|uniref:Uncharacterized protein n=1 Tax=Pseudomonas phage Zuri TaxID=2604899 RepID=A0A5C1K5F6_9CAUD|nr:membrane protein [Pseudomonas phage Zuri]QEM41099.1 hypothetical protein Zuri_2 [Pseudomonas phage Zuri]